ncbi:MAG: hypothetical protein Q9160_007141 [Pyrenula sp. 1 TL-2023]
MAQTNGNSDPARVKTWVPLENNPDVMNPLAYNLGLSRELAFYDVYSFDDKDLLSFIPRPAIALLFIYPYTELHKKALREEDATLKDYDRSGIEEPVMWFPQTVRNACGLMGLLHCALNGEAQKHITAGSVLDKLLEGAIDLKSADRARLIYDSEALETAHAAAAQTGASAAPDAETYADGHGFIAFVRGTDGHLWELDGGRKGPLDRGELDDGDDALSSKFVELGIRPYLQREQESRSQDLEFSITVLTSAEHVI